MKSTIIIPARLASTRFPEKALVDIYGTSLIMRVYNQAIQVKSADNVIVATDHPKIFKHVSDHGGNVIMTSKNHISGTDRIAEVASKIDSEIIINLQGDEPLINPLQIEALISLMNNEEILIGTQCNAITNENEIFDYNVVKVVRDIYDSVLYFSRQAIPTVRDQPFLKWASKTTYFRHVGLYGFKRNTLLEITQLPSSNYEICESLEQLRWLESGYKIHCVEIPFSSQGVDTPEDLNKVVEVLLKENFR